MFTWDLLLMVATLALDVFIVPTLLNARAHVPRTTSGPFAISIGVIAVALFQLGNPLGAAANAAGMALWATVFALRGGENSAVHT